MARATAALHFLLHGTARAYVEARGASSLWCDHLPEQGGERQRLFDGLSGNIDCAPHPESFLRLEWADWLGEPPETSIQPLPAVTGIL
jgi:hypothetical protein